MSFAIELFFDDTLTAAVRRIWQDLAEAGVSSQMLEGGYRPHISLGICDELDIEGFTSAMSVQKMPLLPVMLAYIGLFQCQPGVVFLGGTTTRLLLAHHAMLQEQCRAFAKGCWPEYDVDVWIPHCTLAADLDEDQIGRAVRVCRQSSLPLQGQFQAIGISEVSLTSYRMLHLIPLDSDVAVSPTPQD